MITAKPSADLLLFKIANQQGGLLLTDVVEVLRAIAIVPLPRKPRFVEGIINVRGVIVPVIDMRARFGLPRRKVALTDRFILVRTGSRVVAFRVDEAGAIEAVHPGDIEEAGRVGPDHRDLRGVARLKDGLALVHDVSRFLTATEEEELARALEEVESQ